MAIDWKTLTILLISCLKLTSDFKLLSDYKRLAEKMMVPITDNWDGRLYHH